MITTLKMAMLTIRDPTIDALLKENKPFWDEVVKGLSGNNVCLKCRGAGRVDSKDS